MRLSFERIEAASRMIDPVFLGSPQYVCEPLGDVAFLIVDRAADRTQQRSLLGIAADSGNTVE